MDYEKAGEEYRQDFPDESSEREGMGKMIFTILGFLFFLLIVVALFFAFGGPPQKSVSEKKLIEGATLDVKENNSVKMIVGDEEHNIEIGFVGLDSVDIVINSEPIYATLKIGEVKKFDLNGDGLYDLRVKLLNIDNGKVKIVIKRIEVNVCEERWQCSQWGRCIEGEKRTVCMDVNYCETEDNRPIQDEECLEIVFVGEDNGSEVDNGFRNVTKDNGTFVNGSLGNNTVGNFSDFNVTRDLNHSGLDFVEKSLGEYIYELKSLDCSDYIAPNCRVGYLDDVLEYSKTEEDRTLNFPVYDEDCAMVCFGKAFRNNCERAKVVAVSDSGTRRKLEILGIDNSGDCSVRVDFDFVGESDMWNKEYENSHFICPLSLDENSLHEFSCPEGNCLERDMPGQTFLGILLSFVDVSSSGVIKEGCVGSSVDFPKEKDFDDDKLTSNSSSLL